ncbi:hypothetical protein SAMN04488564_102224 [Lentzea waywayandensis]|uniref:Uncharacterized protein n=1 Tax=Lentzea waywayandensis TaxID=84724 RepID=A0A1I6DC12_9PSEU|nr:hypothetical protein [Lentzea waywayandensis]SFR02990.1 hypothetical protein SAMN04488564_102224 [Lentzea waywayandensis]
MNADWEQRSAARRAEVLALPTIEARHHAPLLPPLQGDVRVSASVGPADDVVALWSSPADLEALTSATTLAGTARFPDSRASRSAGARVTVHVADSVITTHLPGLPVAHPMVQPMPDGQVLVVGARCRWLPQGAERNAIVFDHEGAVLSEHILGDGIEHVQATRRGEVWVGYFDEGVYGNYGWGRDGSPSPMGSCGLTRFSTGFAQEWRFPYGFGGWDAISDCYALNVGNNTTWTCYYTDFPVVRIHDGTITAWHNDVHGAKAIAADGSRVALYGGYGPDWDRLVVGELGDDRLHVTGEFRLVQPDGQPLPRSAEVSGRGADLHVLLDDSWSRLALEDIA